MNTAEDRPGEPRYERIVLAGMMGTGKSTVARILADWLEWELIDTDRWIEEETGKSIRAIFAEEGEEKFRWLETQLVRRIADRRHCVIATGGGLIIADENRRLLSPNTLMVHLHSSLEELARRLSTSSERPLLLDGDTRQSLRKIYQSRAAIYEGLPLQVSTDNKEPIAVAQEILSYLPGSHQILSTNPRHIVHSGLNLEKQLLQILAEMDPPSPLFTIADRSVWELFGARYFDKLSAGFTKKWEIEPILLVGEERSKSIQTAVGLWQKLIASGADRSSCLLTLGGGVIGDVGGFVASTLFRGVRLIHLPTTLLAQVDSAIGGKTGVNLDKIKNMVGTFYPAHHVFADIQYLLTLPERDLRSGLAEVVKSALIGDPELFELLERKADDLPRKRIAVLHEIVSRTAAVKIKIIEEDPLERSGRRILLNLGHTFGHAIEILSDYQLQHGEAVAIGLVLACRLSEMEGLASARLTDRVKTLLDRLGLPTSAPDIAVHKILEKIGHDKKRANRILQFVFPVDIGKVVVQPVPSSEQLKKVLS